VNQKDEGGYTALFYAMLSIGARIQPADLITDEKYKDKQLTVIHHVGEEPSYGNIRPLVIKQIAIVELLINAGIDVNAQDDKGNTILHLLACTDKATTIEYLLRKGATKDIKNAKGETPAAIAESYAAFRKNSEVVALLQ
jgi:ankyrin repeat protein